MEINEKSDYRKLESVIPNVTPTTYVSSVSERPERLLRRSNARSIVKYTGLPASGYFGFVKDGFTTLLNSPWYWIIFFFCCSYCVSWLFFGLVWWGTEEIYQSLYNYTCINNVDSFSSAFLFSLETQVTIGYGFRVIYENCRFGSFVLVLQCLLGLLIDSFMLGLVFAKLTRPRNRRKTILFSDLAVIRSVNGRRCLEFRIADVRRSQLVEAHVRVTLYWYREDDETGESFLEEHDLDVGYDTGRDRVILLAPVIVRHTITPDSPLFQLTSENILNQDFEILVALEGIVECTGLTVQALWSYTEREVLMDYKFKSMISRNKNTAKQSWEVNFAQLSNVVPV